MSKLKTINVAYRFNNGYILEHSSGTGISIGMSRTSNIPDDWFIQYQL